MNWHKVWIYTQNLIMSTNLPIHGKAFISCSLREEDRPFIQMVERILKHYKFEPFGTVGLFSAAPMNPAEHMKENIPKADIVVIVATPRYIQTDLKTGQKSYGLSEMVHVETGMAIMANKPVIVFVQEGTNVGSFLPNVTQYITLNGTQNDLNAKSNLITSLLGNAINIVQNIKSSTSTKQARNFGIGALAVFGGIALLDAILSPKKDEEQEDED